MNHNSRNNNNLNSDQYYQEFSEFMLQHSQKSLSLLLNS